MLLWVYLAVFPLLCFSQYDFQPKTGQNAPILIPPTWAYRRHHSDSRSHESERKPHRKEKNSSKKCQQCDKLQNFLGNWTSPVVQPTVRYLKDGDCSVAVASCPSLENGSVFQMWGFPDRNGKNGQNISLSQGTDFERILRCGEDKEWSTYSVDFGAETPVQSLLCVIPPPPVVIKLELGYTCIPTYNPDFDEKTMLMTTVVQPVTTTAETVTTVTTATTTKMPCASGQFGPFEGTCYQLFEFDVPFDPVIALQTFSWPAAEDNCVALGGHLPSIHSQEQQDFIASISPDIGWIGIHYLGPGYMWTDGTPMDFTYWNAASNAPTMNGPDNCAYMNSNYMNPQRNWDTSYCTLSANPYVCALPQQ